eukprot:scaffold492_cov341-Pavlova_lutheri.AAC.24
MNPSQQQPALMHTLNELKDGTHERRNVTGVVIEACSVPDGGGKGCPLAPVNTRGFTSLYHLWEQLAGASPSSPNCSFMEAEARGVEWRRDSPPSSRRRKGCGQRVLRHCQGCPRLLGGMEKKGEHWSRHAPHDGGDPKSAVPGRSCDTRGAHRCVSSRSHPPTTEYSPSPVFLPRTRAPSLRDTGIPRFVVGRRSDLWVDTPP